MVSRLPQGKAAVELANGQEKGLVWELVFPGATGLLVLPRFHQGEGATNDPLTSSTPRQDRGHLWSLVHYCIIIPCVIELPLGKPAGKPRPRKLVFTTFLPEAVCCCRE